MSIYQILKLLNVPQATYYNWKNSKGYNKTSLLKLTAVEKQSIIDYKQKNPHLSHRKIAGYLRDQGFWLSDSVCYLILKEKGWVLPVDFKEAPWKVSRYEPLRKNLLWGTDFTYLRILGKRYYLLTVMDYYSRYIIAWGILDRIRSKEVQDILTLAYLNEGITEKSDIKIRSDQGKQYIAQATKAHTKKLGITQSFSRTYTPTDNARQERWYRTCKQEQIYSMNYPNVESARNLVGRFIDEYNNERPHQSLFNYTPSEVHRVNNKTILLRKYKSKLVEARSIRINLNRKGE